MYSCYVVQKEEITKKFKTNSFETKHKIHSIQYQNYLYIYLSKWFKPLEYTYFNLFVPWNI